ncbi:MAG: DUF4190 domain-containing protein [Planctomycetota bacterium]
METTPPPPPSIQADSLLQPPRRTSGLAVVSLVLGIVGLLTGVFGIGLLLALVGLILGIVALVQIGNPANWLKGRGMAIWGVVLSGLGLTLMPVALLIGIMLPALGAARTTAQQMASNTQARGIQQAMFTHAQAQTPDASGDRPQTHDLGELFAVGFFTADYTQSPMDEVDGDLPSNFTSMSADDQADWVRRHSDFVLVPGLVDDLDGTKIALFGKPDRFRGGIPVSYNDNTTFWHPDFDMASIEREIENQTGKTMAELIAEAEAMAGP